MAVDFCKKKNIEIIFSQMCENFAHGCFSSPCFKMRGLCWECKSVLIQMALLVECSEIWGGGKCYVCFIVVDSYTFPQLYSYSCYLYPLAYFYWVWNKSNLEKALKVN